MLDILRLYRKDDGDTVSANENDCQFGFMKIEDLKNVFKKCKLKYNKSTTSHVFTRIQEMYGLKYKGLSQDEKSLYFSRPIGYSIEACLPSGGNEEVPF